jgi:hypothetical protein
MLLERWTDVLQAIKDRKGNKFQRRRKLYILGHWHLFGVADSTLSREVR